MSINLRNDITKINIGHYANDWTTGVGFKYNDWQFIAYTYNGTHETVSNGTYSETTARSFTIDPDEKIQIGYWSAAGTGNYWFNGLIDEVRVYNRALSAGEIQEIYNSQRVCAQVITPAISPTGDCEDFPTPCYVPVDWTPVDSCPVPTPAPYYGEAINYTILVSGAAKYYLDSNGFSLDAVAARTAEWTQLYYHPYKQFIATPINGAYVTVDLYLADGLAGTSTTLITMDKMKEYAQAYPQIKYWVVYQNAKTVINQDWTTYNGYAVVDGILPGAEGSVSEISAVYVNDPEIFVHETTPAANIKGDWLVPDCQAGQTVTDHTFNFSLETLAQDELEFIATEPFLGPTNQTFVHSYTPC